MATGPSAGGFPELPGLSAAALGDEADAAQVGQREHELGHHAHDPSGLPAPDEQRDPPEDGTHGQQCE